MFPNFYIHFSHEYGNEFYKQLTSEDIVEIKVRGEVKGIKILNTHQRRNEVLDIVKMNLAAFQYAMDRYFKKYNEWAKSQKQPEIQEDAGMFFDMIADSLKN
jgi:phage terminase large subunit GpA-like protein